MTQRLSTGGLIDRAAPLAFSFDGKSYQGHAGDTLASALLANDIHLVGRSFKYHRPRGILTAGSEEPNALVELRAGARREPNTKATTIELYDGLIAQSQNRWPSLAFDLMAVNSLAAPLFSAGFYYKTFMWPASAWEKLYEPIIRRAAGLGRLEKIPDADHYEKATLHCDVLVIGAGPAGLAAALAVARSGARVVIADEDFRLGGRLLSERLEIDGAPAFAFADHAAAELESLSNVTVLSRTSVFGVYDGGTYGALERVADHLAEPRPHEPRQRFWRIIAKRAVLASGAIERPIAFGGNDRPGILMASASRTYLNRFAVRPATRLVVVTNGDDGYRTAFDAADAGVAIAAILDARAEPGTLAATAQARGLFVERGALPLDAHGGLRVQSLTYRDGAGRTRDIPCDGIAVAGGWNPTVALTVHLGGKPAWNDALAAFVPGRPPPGMMVAGAANGALTLGRALAEGFAQGRAAAEAVGRAVPTYDLPRAADEASSTAPVFHVAGAKGKSFVDFQHDVTTKDIVQAHREGYRAVEHLKRYTTLGMATDQGKTANVTGLAVMAELTGRSIPDTGVTLTRPPFTPVAIGALAGSHRGKTFKPTRLPPTHEWAKARGAIFMETGLWLRGQWFPIAGEDPTDWMTSVNREVRQTRQGVGLCDVSTLGKIDVKGPDAAIFLDRLYSNIMSSLAVGKVRYGLMLREDGFVMDDGTAARFAPDHYVVSTTTANAAKVMQHMEFARQALWPNLKVAISSVTDQWAQISLAGPRARDLIARVVDAGFDVSNEAFPYMACAPVSVGGVRGRLYRVSFSGELAYEVAVPMTHGAALMAALYERGQDLGVVVYGLEALGVMRIEKGHVAGNELNGTTTAYDLGLGKMVKAKGDFIGKALATRPLLLAPDRMRLVGLKPVDPKARLRGGAHFVASGAAASAENDEGYMTSVCYSEAVGSWIGLGLLSRGPERHGEVLRALDPVRGGDVEVEVVDPIFVDREGARLRV